MKTLTEARKADRAAMAKALVALAESHGAACTVTPEGSDSYRKRRAAVTINAPRGLDVTIDFDGESPQPNIFVNAWHMGLETDARLALGRFPNGDVNPHHQSKCTTVSHSFDALLDHVGIVLTRANTGDLFDLEKEAQDVAKNGTWQEQAARFAQWREELTTA